MRSCSRRFRAIPAEGGSARTLRRPAALDASDPLAAIRALDDIALWREHGTAWDARNNRERQLIEDTLVDGARAARVVELCEQLGLRSHHQPAPGPHDAFLVLGGARLAPLMRARWMAQASSSATHTVLLGAPRVLKAQERDAAGVQDYAPGALTEFDLMRHAGRCELGLQLGAATVESAIAAGAAGRTVAPHQVWEWHHWPLGGDALVHAISAPASIPGSRTNTEGSVCFAAGGLQRVDPVRRRLAAGNARRAVAGLELRPGASLVCFTSAIYAPYQQLEVVRALGIDGGCHVQTVAHPVDWNLSIEHDNLRTATTYLQEVRSTFQAALRLADHADPPGQR